MFTNAIFSVIHLSLDQSAAAAQGAADMDAAGFDARVVGAAACAEVALIGA